MTFTVLGYSTRGQDRGKSVVEYIEADTPEEAGTTIIRWHENNVRVNGVICGRHEVFRSQPGLGPSYAPGAPSPSQRRQIELSGRGRWIGPRELP